MGFQINPYDPCIANKMVNGTQMMIRWHVDDLMMSHVSRDEIMKIVQEIKNIYGENLTKNIGKVHDDLPQRSLYLGLTRRCLISMSLPVVMLRTAVNISSGNFLQDALRAVMCWLVTSL